MPSYSQIAELSWVHSKVAPWEFRGACFSLQKWTGESNFDSPTWDWKWWYDNRCMYRWVPRMQDNVDFSSPPPVEGVGGGGTGYGWHDSTQGSSTVLSNVIDASRHPTSDLVHVWCMPSTAIIGHQEPPRPLEQVGNEQQFRYYKQSRFYVLGPLCDLDFSPPLSFTFFNLSPTIYYSKQRMHFFWDSWLKTSRIPRPWTNCVNLRLSSGNEWLHRMFCHLLYVHPNSNYDEGLATLEQDWKECINAPVTNS